MDRRKEAPDWLGEGGVGLEVGFISYLAPHGCLRSPFRGREALRLISRTSILANSP